MYLKINRRQMRCSQCGKKFNELDLSEEQKIKLNQVNKVSPLLGKMHRLKEEFRNIFEQSQDWKAMYLMWLRIAITKLKAIASFEFKGGENPL
ncbi:MAG: transposase [Spirulinaceae cyanobacterium]